MITKKQAQKMVKKRQPVTINPEELAKLTKMEKIRPDLQDLSVSKKVHVALQEWFKENLKSPAGSIHETNP